MCYRESVPVGRNMEEQVGIAPQSHLVTSSHLLYVKPKCDFHLFLVWVPSYLKRSCYIFVESFTDSIRWIIWKSFSTLVLQLQKKHGGNIKRFLVFFCFVTICCRPEFDNCMTWSETHSLTHSLLLLGLDWCHSTLAVKEANAKLANIVAGGTSGADVGVEESIADYKLVTADSLATAWQ